MTDNCPEGINEGLWKACHESWPLDPYAVAAFRDHQESLLCRKDWPIHGYYNDEEFCRALNTAIALQDELIEQLEVILEWEGRIAIDQWCEWRNSAVNARILKAGDRLVELGLWERRTDTRMNLLFYRRRAAPKGKETQREPSM